MLEALARALADRVVHDGRPRLVVELIQEAAPLPNPRAGFHLAQDRIVDGRGRDLERRIELRDVVQAPPATLTHLEATIPEPMDTTFDRARVPLCGEH